MFDISRRIRATVLLATLFVAACGDGTSGPDLVLPSPSPITPREPAPAPQPPAVDLSAIAGEWNVTLRVTEVAGDGCVADTRAPYSLSITADGTVTLTGVSGEYSCSFVTRADGSSGFTTDGVTWVNWNGFSCKNPTVPVRCGDFPVDVVPVAQVIDGRVSGNEITGTWGVWWAGSAGEGIFTTTFTGTR